MPLNLACINLSLNRYDYGGVAGVEYGYDNDDDIDDNNDYGDTDYDDYDDHDHDHADNGTPSSWGN